MYARTVTFKFTSISGRLFGSLANLHIKEACIQSHCWLERVVKLRKVKDLDLRFMQYWISCEKPNKPTLLTNFSIHHE